MSTKQLQQSAMIYKITFLISEEPFLFFTEDSSLIRHSPARVFGLILQ